MSGLFALTGVAGPAGVFGPGGIADLTSGNKDAAPAAGTVAAPVAVTAGGLSTKTLLLGGAGLVALLLVLRQ